MSVSGISTGGSFTFLIVNLKLASIVPGINPDAGFTFLIVNLKLVPGDVVAPPGDDLHSL